MLQPILQLPWSIFDKPQNIPLGYIAWSDKDTEVWINYLEQIPSPDKNITIDNVVWFNPKDKNWHNINDAIIDTNLQPIIQLYLNDQNYNSTDNIKWFDTDDKNWIRYIDRLPNTTQSISADHVAYLSRNGNWYDLEGNRL